MPPLVAVPATVLVRLVLLLLAIAAATLPAEPCPALARVTIAAAAVLLLPGLAWIERFGLYADADAAERAILGVAVSYVITTATCVAATLLRLSLSVAFAFLLAGTAGLILASWRWPRWPPPGQTVPTAPAWTPADAALHLVSAFGAVVVLWFAWRVEARIMGEEAVEIVTIRKVLESPRLSLTGLLHRPDAVPTYVFVPYYFTLALLTKASGLPLFAAYVKMRVAYVAASLLAFRSLIRRVSGDPWAGSAATAVLALLLIADPDPWQWPASLLPLDRRGAFAAGVLLPASMLAVLHAATPGGRRTRWLPPALFLALAMTHALEVVFALFFVAGLVLAAWTCRDWATSRRAALTTALITVACVGLFRAAHAWLVPHVRAYERARQATTLHDLIPLLRHPVSALFSGVPEGARYVVSSSGAVTVYAVFPLVLIPALIVLDRRAGALMWAATLPPLLLYSTPLTFTALVALSTNEIVFAAGYFSVLGLATFVLLVVRAWSAADRLWPLRARAPAGVVTAALAGAAAGLIAAPLCRAIMHVSVAHPAVPVLVGLPGGALALMATAHRARRDSPRPRPETSLAVLATVVPLLVGMKAFPGNLSGSDRASMVAKARAAAAVPSVLDWDAYYPVFQRWCNPPIDLPWVVVQDLRRIVPPLQVLVYDPDHSYTVPVLLNEYIVNPGFLLSTDMQYFRDWVTTGEDGEPVHPIFNRNSSLTPRERQFLSAYRVGYVLTNPRYADVVRPKMAQAGFTRVYARDGFLAFAAPLLSGTGPREASARQ